MEELAGMTFSRSIQGKGDFGQPKGKRSHTVSFSTFTRGDGVVVPTIKDNAGTFFGNRPSTHPYVLKGNTVFVLSTKYADEDFSKEAEAVGPNDKETKYYCYVLSDDRTTLYNGADAVLTRVEK